MPELGEDVKEIYDDLGVSVTIISQTPVVPAGKLIYELNAQVTKPFIREHHLEATFPFDTIITVDDVLQMDETGKNYLVMNKTPDMFEDAVVEWNSILYLSNLPDTACILRPIEIRNAKTYNMEAGWAIVQESPIYGLMSDRIFGTALEENAVLAGQFQIWRIDCYLPKSYDIQSLDRLYVREGEYYKIESKQAYTYPGVDVWLLTEDTRSKVRVEDDIIYEEE